VAGHSWIIMMEICHFSLHIELVVHMPAIMTLIISLSLDKVLKVIVPHIHLHH
jgi:hypothetical protein